MKYENIDMHYAKCTRHMEIDDEEIIKEETMAIWDIIYLCAIVFGMNKLCCAYLKARVCCAYSKAHFYF